MSDYLGHYLGPDGYKVVGPDGYPRDPAELAAELESEPTAPALDVPTIDVEPESVKDAEIPREIES